MRPPPTGADQSPSRRLLDAQQLAGWDILDSRGRSMGSVAQLVLDLLAGRLAYVVVASGDFLGLGERRFMVPWAGLRAADDGSRRFVWLGDPDASRAVPGLPGPLSVPSELNAPSAFSVADCGKNYQSSRIAARWHAAVEAEERAGRFQT